MWFTLYKVVFNLCTYKKTFIDSIYKLGYNVGEFLKNFGKTSRSLLIYSIQKQLNQTPFYLKPGHELIHDFHFYTTIKINTTKIIKPIKHPIQIYAQHSW